jgi:tetratricopeptide (TPR) repeat protein
MGLGQLEVAAGHLRIAARICPPDRRAFHWATLGALLRFSGRAREAIEAFAKASRWATKDRSLYRAQQALCEAAAELAPSADLSGLRQSLESGEAHKGYTLWVLGELCALLGDAKASREYLTSFLSRTHGASPAKNLALKGEIAHAEALLQKLSA